MRLSKSVQKTNWVVLATTLLLLVGLSAAQNPNPKTWGKEVDGLQMRICLDQADGGQSRLPKFRVEMRNVGQNDLLLHLGVMTRDGAQQYPNAVSLILVGAQGEPQRLELKESLQVSDAGMETLLLPLPVRATFSLPVDLGNYRTVISKELEYQLKSGSYWLAAQFIGFSSGRTAFARGTSGQPPIILARTFDMVNPVNTRGPAPISNTLQFEIPTR